ncbi:MDR/zinc-dependent alcohol dehydrogenase-like family protein [Paraliomyxa miuraensis]|uniref:MDR/zinc-dependent alcohol dehydrogenase-like family protein n=1 Tax=Paraliomyxa miuraensis TaxID=376150 RepID=UPI002254C287|nr:alcohol dehydrogenase catalytic domain-containing protein [Paraliomyxa miuraensis]MCX4240843.1 alcohol dehydrogenase catalytic domain-containing protein [Paraliomyxa miuraensis]
MLALTFDGAVALRDVPEPNPGSGHAVVALRLAGICGTDLELTRGYKGFGGVLGHEFVGEVVRCDDDPQWQGKRVVGEINLGCGTCERCASGLRSHCASRRVLGILDHPGCFGERFVLPAANLHAVPGSVADEQAVFTEPLAAAFRIFEQVALEPTMHVAVIGDGKLGLLVVMALRAREIPVTLVGRHPRKLALVAGPGVRTSVAAELGGERFDVVVEATGSRDGLALAFAHVRPRGTVVLKSTVHGTVELPTAALVVDEIQLVGSRCGPFDVALQAMASGAVDPRPLIEARYPLVEGERAFEHASRRGVLKVLLGA